MPIPQSDWQALLQPASFRGVPFVVLDNRIATGRRAPLHQYPYRDTPYAEDMGRRARRIEVTAFTLGLDAPAQAAAVLDAMEQGGPGLLVHPTQGSMMMQPDGPVDYAEKWDKGRYVELRLIFVEPGVLQYPTMGNDTQAASAAEGANAQVAATSDYQAGYASVT